MDITPNLQEDTSLKVVGTVDVGGGRGDTGIISSGTRIENKNFENNIFPLGNLCTTFIDRNTVDTGSAMKINAEAFDDSKIRKISFLFEKELKKTKVKFQAVDDEKSIDMSQKDSAFRLISKITSEASHSEQEILNYNVNKDLCDIFPADNTSFQDEYVINVKAKVHCQGMGEKTDIDDNPAPDELTRTPQVFALVESEESGDSGSESDFCIDFDSYFTDRNALRVSENIDTFLPMAEVSNVEDVPLKTDIASFGIEKLSPELLLLIFSFCSTQDLQQNVPLVCIQWRELARRPCLRRELRLCGADLTSEEVCRRLGEYPNLRLLEVEERHDLDKILSFVATGNPRLCSLVIKRCWNPLKYDVVSEEVLKRLFKACRRLTSLTIKKCPFSGFFEVFDCNKEHLRRIRKLNLNYVEGLKGARDVQFICEFCPHLEDLRALTRPACTAHLFYVCQDADLRLIASRLCNTLRVLKLEGDAISDSGVEALTQCSRLRKLCLRCVRNITDVGLLELSHLKELGSLELVDVALPSAEGWKQLFKRCVWHRMHTLLLARCINIDDEALLWVSRICKRVVRLSLAGCYLATSKGLKIMFKACPMIEELVLCLSQSKGCIFWIPALVPNIKKIVYHSCYRLRLSQNAEEEYSAIQKVFRKKYPFLKIRYVENLNDLMLVS